MAARLCNDYRNLIHQAEPGGSEKYATEELPLLTVAALEHVVADLSPQERFA